MQTKHHWWWKANHIFHNLEVARHFTGTVVFLEEDHFVAEDFLHILGMMQYEQKNNFNEVQMSFNKTFEFYKHYLSGGYSLPRNLPQEI